VAAAGLLLELESATTIPPAGAYPLRVTVPVEVELEPPPTTVVGFKVNDAMPVATGFTVSVACAEPVALAVAVAVMVVVAAEDVTN